MISLGIDIGSRNTKIVIWDNSQKEILFSAYTATGVIIKETIDALLDKAGNLTSSIKYSCATGYGRKMYKEADSIKSEITCHAKACHMLFPQARTVIDIGGQDSKVITLTEAGNVEDFIMNDKCAAGTGRFLEMTANKLECDISELSDLASKADKEIPLNSTCVVFAESEIIGLLAKGEKPENIARAVNNSIAKRIYAQMAPLNWQAPIVFTGGVAQGSDLVHCIGKACGHELHVPFDPEITGALGAAILAF
ncbi:MAG TPA: 2-hydroxyglutaryl-CoA dehydratase [Candidatus Cloacimonetes bacterium]|nr:2-hydroxyglutaryl-CoA dehydratase [Candidatus Cloacimonadota bacterium]